MTKRQKFFSALGQFLKNVFTKNILLKVVALVFALLLWGYVLSEVKPKYVKRIYDVEIELRNEDALKQKGWVVVDDETYVTDVNIEAEIDKHSMLDNTRVMCYVDLEKIPLNNQDPDRKTVVLDVATSYPEYGVLKSVSVEQISLTIERTWKGNNMTATVRTENSLPSIVKTGDQLPEYFECIPPKTVTVPALSGLKSEIEQISRAEVTIDLASFEEMELSNIPGTYSLTLPVVFYDVNGQLIDSASTKDVKVTVDNIEIRRYKEVPIEVNMVLDDAFNEEFYECVCEIDEDAEKTVRIYGDADELAKISSVKTEVISPNMTEGVESVAANLIIPKKVSTDRKETTTINITVSKRMSDEIAYEIPIAYTDILDNTLILADAPETLTVRVSGFLEAMADFDEKWITATVDLVGRGAGTHNMPVTITFKGIDLYVEDYRVEESDDGSEPVIRITYAAADGAIYQFVLSQKTVSVKLEKVEEPTDE